MIKRRIGITGSQGFVAGHLIRRLEHQSDHQLVLCPRKHFENSALLAEFVKSCDTIVHLAAINRGSDEELFATNISLVDRLIAAAEKHQGNLQILFASSTQRDRDNAYGKSKRQGEERIRTWASRGAARTAKILVIPNVYGPGCRPFYNSVVATFCHELAHGSEPKIVEDRDVEFVWINDLVDNLVDEIEAEGRSQLRRIEGTALLTVSQLLSKLRHFHCSHVDRNLVPDISDPLDASLYATYLSYLSMDQHRHRPQVHRDDRGKLFEIIRMANGGQVFFSTTKPGVVRGDHFHTRKVEWFCVLKGEAAIRLRRVDSTDVHEFRVSGESPQFISIPVLHAHQIENIGDDELLTMFWCNEIFTSDDPDTYFEKVA